jgi:hypothetical protein
MSITLPLNWTELEAIAFARDLNSRAQGLCYAWSWENANRTWTVRIVY